MSCRKSCFSGLHYSCPLLISPSPSRDHHIHSASRRKRVLHLSRHEVCAADMSGEGFEHSQMVPRFSQHVCFCTAIPASWTGTDREPISRFCWVGSLHAALQHRKSKPGNPQHSPFQAHTEHAGFTAPLGLGSAHLTASTQQVPFKRLFFLFSPSKRHFHLSWKISGWNQWGWRCHPRAVRHCLRPWAHSGNGQHFEFRWWRALLAT